MAQNNAFLVSLSSVVSIIFFFLSMFAEFQNFSVGLGNTLAKKMLKTQEKLLYIMSGMAWAYLSIFPRAII